MLKKIYLLIIVSILNINEPHGAWAQDYLDLEEIENFPSYDDHEFFQFPQNFVFDDEGKKLFVNDQSASQVIVYNSDGEFIKRIGREGKGPGELINPSGVVFGNGHIFVNDQGNQRIQIYKETGEFIESIILDDFPFWGYSFAYHNEKLIFFPRYHLGLAGKEALNKHSLFKVLDLNGKKVIDEFGEFPIVTDNMHYLGARLQIRFHEKHFYVLFQSYPLLRKYSPSGDLIFEKDISEYAEDYKSIIEKNSSESSFKPGGLAVSFLYTGFDVSENSIYMAYFDDKAAVIDELDLNGIRKQRYYKEMESDSFSSFQDFRVNKTNDNLLFYFLVNRLIPQIMVLKTK